MTVEATYILWPRHYSRWILLLCVCLAVGVSFGALFAAWLPADATRAEIPTWEPIDISRRVPLNLEKPLPPCPGPPSGVKGLWYRLKSKGDAGATLEVASTVLAVLTPVMDLLSEVSGNIGVPVAKLSIDCLSQALKKAEQMNATKESARHLGDRIGTLKRLLESVIDHDRNVDLPAVMRKRIVRFIKSWQHIEGEAAVLVGQGSLKRYWMSGKDAADLNRLVQKMDSLIQDFLVESNAAIESAIHNLAETLISPHEEEYMPRQALGARYDHNDARKGCLPGTRVDIIEDVCSWIFDDEGERVLWLNGVAGTGKTSIAYSLAQRCDRWKLLCASFFCSRSDAECSDVSLVFGTIVYQLCRFSTDFKKRVLAIIKADRSLLHAGIDRQVRELLARPIQEINGALRHAVILFDALDECKDDTPVSTILTALELYITPDWPKIILTSRPEPHITAAFSGHMFRNALPTRLVLHEIQIPTVEADITRLLEHGFAETRNFYRLPPEWPKREDIEALAKFSGGLFVIASTSIKFVQDTRTRLPTQRLEQLLSMKLSSHGIVDHLYQGIVNNVFSEIDSGLAEILSKVLGALVVLQQPQPADALATLVGYTENDLRCALSGLHSVLLIPDDNHGPIQFFHPTFPEFLLREISGKPPTFHVQPALHHIALLSHCFDLMSALKRNMLCLEEPALSLDQIIGPDWVVPEPLSTSGIQYACLYWSHHLTGQTNRNIALLRTVYPLLCNFVTRRLLYWIEACVIFRAVDNALESLNSAWRTCQTLEGLPPETTLLLGDCRRLISAHIHGIRDSPLQIYISALPFAPLSTLLTHTYASELEDSIGVQQGVQEDWSPCLSTFAIEAECVIFSPDGLRFATSRKENITIWRTSTCDKVLSIQLPYFHPTQPRSCCVAFSPDGSCLARCQPDKIHIWDVNSGKRIRTLEGHDLLGLPSEDHISYVTYSADGTRILSTTFWGEIKLWDAHDGRCLYTDKVFLRLNPGQVSFSSGRDEGMVAYLTRTSSELIQMHFRCAPPRSLPDEVQWEGEIVLSSGACYVAGRNFESRKLFVRRVADSTLLDCIDLPQGPVKAAFSGDGAQIVCALDDGTLCLHRIGDREPPQVLEGHLGKILDVAWSPGDSQIISAGIDRTIRIWETSRPTAPRETHKQPPSSAHSDERSAEGLHRFAVFTSSSPDPRLSPFELLWISSPTAFPCSTPTPMSVQIPDDAPYSALTLCSDANTAWNIALSSPAFRVHYKKLCNMLARNSLWEALCGLGHGSVCSISQVCMSGDGGLLAYISQNWKLGDIIKVCNLYTAGQPVATLTGSRGISWIALSSDATHLAGARYNGQIKVWSLDTGALIWKHKIPGRDAQLHNALLSHTPVTVRGIAISSDDRFVVSGSQDGLVIVSELETGTILRTFTTRREITKVTFSLDGRHVIAQLAGKSLDIWNVKTGRRMGLSTYKDITISPDNTGILVAQSENTAAEVVTLWQPNRSIGPPFYWVDDDGWIYGVGSRGSHRLGWLPADRRRYLPSGGDTLFVVDLGEKHVINLKMSRLVKYVHDSRLHC